MLDYLVNRSRAKTISIHPVSASGVKKWLSKQRAAVKNWAAVNDFAGKPGQICLVPSADGHLDSVLVGTGPGPWSWAGLPARLRTGRYAIAAELDPPAAQDAAMGWALGCYEFTRYRKPRRKFASLIWPDGADRGRVARLVHGIALARDLITTPAGDLGPADLAEAAKTLARKHRARCTTIVGDALIEKKYPAIHAVGRAAAQAPRLIDLRWGNTRHKKLTLVGKGVCFDTGGLHLKPASGIQLMKKDMGGAAMVLGLAHAIMDAKLPVRLRVLIPAVENSVAGNAFHPLDVLQTRKGKTVEVGNTDAEGRLILSDALAEADSENPDLIVDVATLTGAARVALGTSLPALFSSDDAVAEAILAAGNEVDDQLWRMPLHEPYRRYLDSHVADLNNISESRYGGAITAALFLREFVSAKTPWVHIDTMGWNSDSKPGRPKGGEAFALRAMYRMCEQRYGR
ncbi:MAG: leucyl aminopeptidase family protein [Proteobacteria bacterium]|nr:leucyl aminopeptidase family protein [Pseudomonadota bacterium]